MKVSEILIIILGLIVTIVVVFQMVKFRYGKLTESQIIFWRLWIYKSKLTIDRNTILEITESHIRGNCIGYYITLKNKSLRISPRQVTRDSIEQFAKKNGIRLICEESFHGGGIEILNDPDNRNKYVC